MGKEQRTKAQKETVQKKVESGKRLSPGELNTLDSKWTSIYISRIIKECADALGKRPQELVWFDFREYISFGYGKNKAGITPKSITRCGGFNTIRDAYYPPDAFPEAEEKTLLRRTAQLNRKYASQEIYDNLLLKRIQEVTGDIYGGKFLKVPYFRGPKKKDGRKKRTKRILHTLWSDLHYQSQIQLAETGTAYGSKEEARRTARLCKTIAEYKMDHREETVLHIYLAGDIIQNQLHDLRDGSPLAEQSAAAVHILIQAITFLSTAFKEIKIFCATGNHGRNTARHKGRAVNQKWDSIETIIYYAIKKATEPLGNVTFDIPKTAWFTAEAFGHKYFGTHGDTHFNPGNPGKNIKTSGLENQSNRWNAMLPDTNEYKVFMVGHVHTPTALWMPNGSVLMVNGALCPPDGFAQSLPIPEGANGQWIWESTPEHPIGDIRFVVVGKEDDEDESLESIIKPFEDF